MDLVVKLTDGYKLFTVKEVDEDVSLDRGAAASTAAAIKIQAVVNYILKIFGGLLV